MFNTPIQLTPKQLWGAVTAIAVLLSVTAAITWEIRKDYIDDLKRQLETYEKSGTWKLPETLSEIRSASQLLTLQLSEKQELDRLRKLESSLLAEKKQLEATLKQTNEKLVEAQRTLESMTLKATTFELQAKHTASLVANNIFLGLKSIHPDYVSVTISNESHFLGVGESKSYSFGGKRCTVTLLKISPDRATFSHGCT